MKIIRKLILLQLIMVVPLVLFAQIEKRSDVGYQGPSTNEIQSLPIVATLHPSGHANTDIKNFQNAINTAARKKGGRIIVEKGNYQLKDIQLKSNVHFECKKGVVFMPRLDLENNTKVQLIFAIGRFANENIENVTFIGEGDISQRPRFYYDRTIAKKCRAFTVGKVTNLYIQNFSVTDDQTVFSAISLNMRKKGTSKNDRPKNVTIKDLSIYNASYGYGLVQGNTGENIWLKNLQSIGGVTARIETHTGREHNVGVDNVIIEDVVCTQGKAAVSMQPHVVENGVVTVNRAKAIRCEWGVMIKDGFISKKLDKSKHWELGSFAKGSSIKNVEMIHGEATTISRQSKVYIPDALMKFYQEDSSPDKETGIGCKLGPSIAAILNLASDEVDIDKKSISHTGKQSEDRLLIVTEEVKRVRSN
ncbi:glycoside hydrolase family protein [Flammeovirga agarivorans]|uniref:Uncharacterized protein n=1 Tax=Flammeovirga agarivorans TaxID=2726742 RepID=A0A7X8SNK0_9BACT|nr:hypothetical protein [Flammeovirga agarivorans]NLR93412.1 hypothetical protein [Flammeovirga agarivorans]